MTAHCAGNRFTHHSGKSRVRQSVCHADHRRHHQNQRGEQVCPCFFEIEHADQAQETRGKTRKDSGNFTQRADHHCRNGHGKSKVSTNLFPLGQLCAFLHLCHSGFFLVLTISLDIIVRQQSVSEQGPQEEADRGDKHHQRELRHGNGNRHTGTFQQGDRHTHEEGDAHRNQGLAGRKSHRQQNLGVGKILAVGNSRSDGDNHNIVAGGAAHQACAQHRHQDQQRISLEPALGCQVSHQGLDSAHQTGFLQSSHNRHKSGDHNHAAVDKSRKGPLNGGNPGENQQAACHHRGCSERELVGHNHYDHQNRNGQCQNHLGCHTFSPNFLFLSHIGGQKAVLPSEIPVYAFAFLAKAIRMA